MTNPLLELERTLVPAKEDEAEEADELDGDATEDTAFSRSRSRSRSRGRARAQALALRRPLRYRVPGSVPLIAQPGSMNGWAAMVAMLLSWRDGRSLGVEEAVSRLGSQYEDHLRRNAGLPVAEKAGLLAAAGIAAEPPTKYTPEDLERMLRENGPLWVTYDDANARLFSLHGRLIVGISGTAHGRDVRVEVINPETGRQYSEPLGDLLKRFARAARTRGAPRLQVLHARQPAPSASNGSQPAAAPAAAPSAPAPTAQGLWVPATALQAGPAQAQGGPAAIAGPVIAGAGFLYGVLKDMASNRGDVTWRLQGLDGAKFPRNDPAFYHRGQWTGPYKFQVKGAVENPLGDEQSATFDVEYWRNGLAVGFVDVSVANSNDAWIGTLDVTQTIRGLPDDTSTGGEIGTLELRFHYVWDQPFFDPHIYRETVTLYGDGRARRLRHWPQP